MYLEDIQNFLFQGIDLLKIKAVYFLHHHFIVLCNNIKLTVHLSSLSLSLATWGFIILCVVGGLPWSLV